MNPDLYNLNNVIAEGVRDAIALEAMKIILQNSHWPIPESMTRQQAIAEYSYVMADAMLKARG